MSGQSHEREEGRTVCDFSVVAERQRDYRDGEILNVTQLGPHTKGLTSPSDRQTAVCIRNNACMMIPELPANVRERLNLSVYGKISAIFAQLPNRGANHRDALIFENGRTILINDLPLDLEMSVHDEHPVETSVDKLVETPVHELVAVR